MSVISSLKEREHRSAVWQLSKKSRKLRCLRELHALKVANSSLQDEVEQVMIEAERTQREVMNLLMQVERFTGEYDSLQERLSTIRNAVEEKDEIVDLLESAA